MNELRPMQKDKLEVYPSMQISKKKEFIGSIIPQKGHICYQFNLNDKSLTIANFEETNFSLTGGLKKKLLAKPDCIYVTSLNKKNAIKKIAKIFKNTKE